MISSSNASRARKSTARRPWRRSVFFLRRRCLARRGRARAVSRYFIVCDRGWVVDPRLTMHRRYVIFRMSYFRFDGLGFGTRMHHPYGGCLVRSRRRAHAARFDRAPEWSALPLTILGGDGCYLYQDRKSARLNYSHVS